MSTLVFDGTAHTLTLLDSAKKQVGSWYANNRVDSHATLRFVPNRTYKIIDPSSPHRHSGDADSVNGPYGSYGIIRLENFPADGHMHDGVGVHAGRANKSGPDHATMGCIRTSEEAMAGLTKQMATDPIQSITVQNNKVQGVVNTHKGDPHHPEHHKEAHTQHPLEKSHKTHAGDHPEEHKKQHSHSAHHKEAHAEKKKHATPDYQKLFDTAVIDTGKLNQIDHAANTIITNKKRYEAVVAAVPGSVPWWFVGLVHKMEANFSFKRHLHNGDPLSARTVHVPAGRPTHGAPPYTWEASAEDAVTYQGLTKVTDWSLAHALHLLEGYNGYGYQKHGVNSPYLWSYSNHYTKGKYVKDGVYDPDAVSQQVGSALVLKRLVDKGAVVLGN